MKVKHISKNYIITEAQTNDRGQITGFKAIPKPSLCEKLDYEIYEASRQLVCDAKLFLLIVGIIGYILFVLRTMM